MWQYRELIKNLTVAEIKNRYQNTVLGFFWSILSPFLLAVVLWFVFRNIFKQEENFAVNLLVGIMVWRFFANGTFSCLVSVVAKPNLVTRVYIPRQILVLSTALSSLFTSFLEILILLPIIFALTGGIPWTACLFPFAFILYFWIVYGLGLILAALFVYFRDLSQIWDVLINALFFCSPIVYPISAVPYQLVPYYMLNPITRIIFVYRDLLVAGTLPSLNTFLLLAAFGAGFFLFGHFAFQKLQRRFAEAI